MHYACTQANAQHCPRILFSVTALVPHTFWCDPGRTEQRVGGNGGSPSTKANPSEQRRTLVPSFFRIWPLPVDSIVSFSFPLPPLPVDVDSFTSGCLRFVQSIVSTHQTHTLHYFTTRMQNYPDSIHDDFLSSHMVLIDGSSEGSKYSAEDPADLHRKAFQPGADPTVNMTCQDPAWGALHSLLPTASSNNGSTNSEVATTTSTICQDGVYRPSPKDSPLSASSLGSPNSARDFDTDTPLITGQDDFHLGYEQINSAGYTPLFNILPQAGDASAWATMHLPYGPSTQQAFNAEQAPFANSYTYTAAQGDSAPLPHFLASSNTAPTDIDPSVLNGASSAGLLFGQHALLGAHGHDDIDSAVNRLSLSESVSGYSSGSETENSTNSNLVGSSSDPSGAPTPSASSGQASPVTCSAPSQQTIAQVMGGMVRERLVEAGQYRPTLTPNLTSQGISGNVNANFHDVLMPLFSSLQGQPNFGASDACQSPSATVAGSTQASIGQQSHPAHPVAQRGSTNARSSARRSPKKVALGVKSNHTEFLVDGKRWFRCGTCPKTFDRAFNLKAHQDVHEPVRVYRFHCPTETCGKRFSRRADCVRHSKTVHWKGQKIEPGTILVKVVDLG